MKAPLIIAIIALVIFSSCGSSRKANQENNDSSPLGQKDNEGIVNKYWKLVTLEGQNITMAANQERESYFMLKADSNRVTGFAGCNNFTGTYTLETGCRIRFSQMATTMKACPDVDVNEGEFLKVFELADNYTLNADTLSLNVGRRAPLAVFHAVYFK